MDINTLEQKYLVLSDVHGNVSALEAVLNECKDESFAGIIILGDLIDYGMRSNEVISIIDDHINGSWSGKKIINIWGNHEKLIFDKDYERLSTERGRVISKYTESRLTKESLKYIEKKMNKDGYQEFDLEGYNCLAVHGSKEDYYWKSIELQNLRGDYSEFDIVLSGHSHYSHAFTYFYPVDDPELRNKKAVTFINPGSVGQPRNQNPRAQYAVLSLPSHKIELRAVEYNVVYEQSLFPQGIIDEFYMKRLTRGI